MSLTWTLLVGLVLAGAAQGDLTLPYYGLVSEAGYAFKVSNSYPGMGLSYGGFFYAGGVEGRGVFGQSAGAEGMGVKGWGANDGNVQNYGGHFCSAGRRGIGVYGWAENLGADARNYGGYFQADGGQGIGLYAVGGPQGSAGVFQGDVVITGWGNGIVFPDGTRQTSAAGLDIVNGGCCCPTPAYDSGWVDLTFDKSAKLTHGVGGNLDDYVVDLELKRDNIIGEQSLTNREIGTDFYYDRLTTSTVTIYGPEMAGMDFGAWVRIRIWLCPSKPSGGGGGGHM